MKPQRIEISYKTIVFTALLTGAIALLWQIKSILILFFVSFILMEVLNPIISKIERLKIPRPVAILIFYTILIALIAACLIGIVPGLIEQTSGLISSLPEIIRNTNIFGFKANMIDWSSQIQLLQNLPSEIARLTISVFTNIFSGIIILVVTFYLLMERRKIRNHALKIFGLVGQEKATKILDILEEKLGHWVNAEIILMIIIGALSYLGYTLIGLKYALPLALLAGLLQIVPNIGPIISIFPAGLIGLTISPLTLFLTVLVGITIHQIEGNLITPKIMKETVGLNPLITIFTIAVGAQLAGIGGALLAVPIYLIVETIVRVLIEK